MMKKAFDAIVSGRVQNVLYRDFARGEARALNVTGEAKNMPDGTVRIRAEGEQKALASLVEKLKKGPPLSRVESVSVSWTEPSDSFTDFSATFS
ncbi:MAG: acylphosphatase [Patescibacteria group bacterium]